MIDPSRFDPTSSPGSGAGENEQPLSMFGEQLGPALQRACGERLNDLHWFRTSWQRGGALTGYAAFNHDGGGSADAVVKLPVPPQELQWLRRLQPDEHDAGEVTPRLFASGDRLNGYDLAWVVMEQLPHGPLSSQWEGEEFDLLVDAIGRFYAAVSRHDVNRGPRDEDWPDILKRARTAVRAHQIAEEQRWSAGLKQLHKRLKKLLSDWDERPTDAWCHGDFHLANALTRRQPPHGPALLIDFAEVHAGHWVEDAVYLEHLYWARPQRLTGRNLVKLVAAARKQYGMSNDPQWPRYADIRRVMLAAAAPAYLHDQGDPLHLRASLDVLERGLQRIE